MRVDAYFRGRKVKKLLVGIVLIICLGCAPPNEPATLAEIRDAIAAGEYGNIHSLIAIQSGQLIAEWYFEGPDERLGTQLGSVAFDRDTLHDLRSVTKSVVSLLFGIALADGALGNADETLEEHFRDYANLLRPEHSRIRLTHLLSMTSGIRWDERTYPYTDRRNSETAMYFADDRLRMILSESIDVLPGERFNYSGGDVELVASIIERATQTDLQAYARTRLFDPLDIEDVEWLEYPDGGPIVASGLRMRPIHMAKIGQLVLQNGRWESMQLVPESWIHESTSFKTQVRGDGRCGRQYGYFWWLDAICDDESRIEYTLGNGNGGQRILIVPDLDIVVVTTAGFYNRDDDSADRVVLAVVSAVSRQDDSGG